MKHKPSTFLLLISTLLAPVFLFAQSFTSSNLPIVVINTGGAEIEEEEKVMVDMGIINNGPGILNSLTDPFNGYNGKIGIEFRGNSTMDPEKKTYSIELWDYLGNDIDASILGMPEEEDWILHASHFDKTFLRNDISFLMWQKMGYWASGTKFCEVVLDGDYRGLYIMMERIKRDSVRLDIAKLKDNDISGDELTGGYLIQMDWFEDTDNGWFSSYPSIDTDPVFFQYFYPKASNIMPQQANYIQSYIDTFETALLASSYTHPGSGERYDEYAELQTFVDLFIINELSRSVDAYKLSSFLYKDKDSKGGKLSAGPIWDFDNAYYGAEYCGCAEVAGWTYLQDADGCDDLIYMPQWWNRLIADPVFTTQLRCRWQELKNDFLTTDTLFSYIDQQTTLIDAAQTRNFQRWDILGENVFAQPEPIPETYDEEVVLLKNWLTDRLAWMDANLPGTCTIDRDPVEPGLAFKVFPNPVSHRLFIESEQRLECARILDLNGKVLMERKDISGSVLNVDALAPGIYFLEVSNQDRIGLHKFIVLAE